MKQFVLCLEASLALITLFIGEPSAFAQHPLKDRADAVEIRYAMSQPFCILFLSFINKGFQEMHLLFKLYDVPPSSTIFYHIET
jgi:hypothetical protein